MALNFPSSPVNGQIYTVGDQSWQYSAATTSWNVVSQAEALGPVYIGSLPPTSPVEGGLWWNSNSGQLYIRYVDDDGGQWVSATVNPPVTNLDSDAVVDALVGELTQYADQAAAVAGGVPLGGLYRVAGSGVGCIRVVV
jgi:hypothetical protein